MAVLADLLVRFGADSAELRKTLKTVESDLNRFTRDVGKMKSALSGAFSAIGIGMAAKALADLVKRGADSADSMGKLAQGVGVPVEELSRLSHAAKMSNVDVEHLGHMLGFMAKAMGDAAGKAAHGTNAFKVLGISVTDADGRLRGTEEVLLEIADRFSTMEDSAAKTALTWAIFGKKSEQIIPLLNEGAAGLRTLGEEADRLGVTISDATYRGADEFNDSLDRMRAIGSSFSKMVATKLGPSLTELANEFTNTASSSSALKEAADALAAGVKVLVSVGVTIAAVFNVAGKAIGATAAALVAAAKGDFSEAARALEVGREDVIDTVSSTMDRLEAVWAKAGAKAEATAPVIGKKLAAPAFHAHEDIEKERIAAVKSLGGMAADLQAKAAGFGKANSAWETMHFRLFSGDLADEVRAAGATGRLWAATILGAVADLERLEAQEDATTASMARFHELVAESEAVWNATRTPAEAYKETLRDLDRLLAEGAIDADTYARAVQQAAVALGDAIGIGPMVNAAVTGLRQMATATGSWADRIKGYFAGILDSFFSMVEQMVARWMTAQLTMKILGLGAGGGGGGIGPVQMPELLPMGAGSGFTVPGVSASRAAVASGGSIDVHFNVTTLDSQSFDGYLAANEGVLANRIQRIVYRGKVG
jgi:hypothetical protein